MITKNSGSFATGKNQLEAMWKCLTDRKLSFGVQRVVPRLVLVPLVCFALLVAGVNRSWAAASSSPIPYKDSYVLQLVSNVNNPDRTQDQVYVGQGTNTIGGSFAVINQVHVVPLGVVCGPSSCAIVFHFTSALTVTMSSGDTLLSAQTGDEIVPLDSSLHPLAPPYAVVGSQQITGGTGRFAGATGSLTFSGLDYRNNTVILSTTGTISTVGLNKTGS